MHIQWVRLLSLFLMCSFGAVVAAATITNPGVWIALVIVVVALTVVHHRRYYRRVALRTVVAHLREPGDEWRVRVNASDFTVKLWDPSRRLGPGNGVRGGGSGTYRLDGEGQVTFDWRPLVGASRRFVGPRPSLAATPPPPGRRNAVRVVVFLGAYAGLVGAGGLAVGLVTDSVDVGVAGALGLMAALSLTAAAVSGWHRVLTGRRPARGV